MANGKQTEKTVAVKARSLSPNGFFRCGKYWSGSGSVHTLEPTDLARLRAEPAVVVMATAPTEAALLDADAKATAADRRLLAAAEARAERKTLRARVTKYDRLEAVEAHIDEIEDDADEDGVTEAESEALKAERAKLREAADSLRPPKPETPKSDTK